MKGGKEKDWALGYAKIIQYNKEISLNLINLFLTTTKQVCKLMVVSLNLVRICKTHQVGQKNTNKSIFTKHKMRLGKIEEETEEAETCV